MCPKVILARAWLVMAVGALSATIGCSSARKQAEASAEQEKLAQSETQLSEARNQITALNQKIQELEGKLGSMADKMTATQTSLDNLMNSRKAAPTGVAKHAAEDRGEEVVPKAAANDPDGGFVNDSAVTAYRQAHILYEAQKYPEAMLAFSSFLERYADHAMAGSAQYYVGECYFRQKEYRLAHQEFQRVLTAYDRSPHVPDTLARMAETADLMKRPEEASKHRQLLTSLFPQSPAARAAKEAFASGGGSSSGSAPAAKGDAPVEPEKPSAPTLDEPPATAPVPPAEEGHEGN